MKPLLCWAVGALLQPLLASVAMAQFVWPANYASQAGNAVMNAPFSVTAGHPRPTTRMMVVIDQASLPFPPGTLLTRLSLRRDVAYANQSYPAIAGNLQLRLGRVASPPGGVQDVRFGRLWQDVPTTVFPTGPFTVPASAAPGASLPGFQVVIPFARNFLYQGGPLGIDMVFTSTSGNAGWRIDAFTTANPVTGVSRAIGEGCVGTNGFYPYHFVLPETTMPGVPMTLQMEGARLPPSPTALENFSFHLLGLQDQSYQGLPLPVSLAAFGGNPACMLRIDPLITTLVFQSNPSALFARARHSVSLPPHPALVGSTLYSQWMVFDGGFAAPLQFGVSDALAITLGQIAAPVSAPRARTIWKYGATGFDIDSGRMVKDEYGPILQFN